VAVVDVLMKPGDVVDIDSPLVTLETDKASMDVPATAAGTITEVLLKRGDKVSKGSLIARVETAAPAASVAPAVSAGAGGEPGKCRRHRAHAVAERGAADRVAQEFNRSTQLLVLGAGPGATPRPSGRRISGSR